MEISHGIMAFTCFLLSCTVFFSFNPFSTFSLTKLDNPLETDHLKDSSDVTGDSVVDSNATSVLRKVGKVNELQKIELGLAHARAQIRKATKLNVSSADEDAPKGMVYRNPTTFYQSYIEMEKRFKVYVYEVGDRPIIHCGPTKNLYTSEGRFIHEMELGVIKFRTRDALSAHVYFLPFSVSMLVDLLYQPPSNSISPLLRFVEDYLRVVSSKHPYWNRTQGADHFMLACHDWGPMLSRVDPNLFNNSIRVLCNANTSEGFDPRKDVTLPGIYFYDGYMSSELTTLPSDNATRPHLAFFAGGLHGSIRKRLLQHWKNRDPDILVYEQHPKGFTYYSFMVHSKYCLCPSGFEVGSPRVVESIYSECVPVIISENYVLPFSDVLRWETFSVQVEVSDIPKLKEILMAIPKERYMRLKEGVRAVKKHFMLNKPPKRFDAFHMIMHSIWLRRLNVRLR